MKWLLLFWGAMLITPTKPPGRGNKQEVVAEKTAAAVLLRQFIGRSLERVESHYFLRPDRLPFNGGRRPTGGGGGERTIQSLYHRKGGLKHQVVRP